MHVLSIFQNKLVEVIIKQSFSTKFYLTSFLRSLLNELLHFIIHYAIFNEHSNRKIYLIFQN
jgi:hypothetical protein